MNNKNNTYSPKKNSFFYGHLNAQNQLIDAWNSNNFAHAWIISGQEGVGKATLAYRFARWVIHQSSIDNEQPILFSGISSKENQNIQQQLSIPTDSPTFYQVSNNSHPNLLSIEPGFDEKTNKLRKEILVNDIRKIIPFFGNTAFNNGWRIVIIDSADQLNRNSSNALLKLLEEPPEKCMIILIANNIGKVLPTVRSRCRELKLKSLNESDFTYIITQTHPNINKSDITRLLNLSNKSPGYAIKLANNNGIEINKEINYILNSLPNVDYDYINSFSDNLFKNNPDLKFHIFSNLIIKFVSRGIRFIAINKFESGISEDEYELINKFFFDENPIIWLTNLEQINNLIEKTNSLNLSKKQVVASIFNIFIEKYAMN